MIKPAIRNFSLTDLEQWFIQKQQPLYRAKQLYQWLWKRNIRRIDEITNIPKSLLRAIQSETWWDVIELFSFQKASDLTIKASFFLYDGLIVEGVIIPSNDRTTACISTQVGCPVRCRFCATGNMGYVRNLNVGEIVDQVVLLNRLSTDQLGTNLTNIVIMGMGEPLLNYEYTLKALMHLTSPEAMNWSKNRITLSTVGIPDRIIQFAHDNPGVKLAVSLHAPFQDKREQLIPLAKKYTLIDILEALKNYVKITNQVVTFEYLMLYNVNDSIDDARELVRICSTINSKVNLIPYNNVEGLAFVPSTEDKIHTFYKFLKNRHINVRIRKSRGQDIDAACGQLANKLVNK